MPGPIVIVGAPCTGKSSLGRLLAERLTDRTHLSVGDLIRADRRSRRLTPRLEASYRGNAPFPSQYLSDLLATACDRFALDLRDTVIDGGPPLDAVMSELGISPRLTVLLEAAEDTRAERFTQRQGGRGRVDDLDSLFRRRTVLYEDHLPGVVAGLADLGPVLRVDSTPARRIVAREVLDAVGMSARLVSDAGDATMIDDFSTWALSTDADVRYVAKAGHSPEPGPILVIKPGVSPGPALLAGIIDRLQAHGYEIAEARRYTGPRIAALRLAPLHFGEQWIYSEHASVLAAFPALGGAEAEVVHGAAWLEHHWERSGPTRVAPRCWVARLPLGDGRSQTVVNGHIPRIVREYVAPHLGVTALRLVGRSGVPQSDWATLRDGFLGATDPRRAPAGSLRGDAYRGTLPVGMPASFQNNCFHLSAGPLEAIRERVIWFGAPSPQLVRPSELLRLTVNQAWGSTSLFDDTASVSWSTVTSAGGKNGLGALGMLDGVTRPAGTVLDGIRRWS